VGSHPHRHSRLLPRASRSHVPRSQPAAPPQALRAPTRTDALVRCFRLSPFHRDSFSPSRMELRMRSRPQLHRSGDPATNSHSGIMIRELRLTARALPGLGRLRPSGFAASGCAASSCAVFQCPARPSGPMPSAHSLSTLPILLPASARCPFISLPLSLSRSRSRTLPPSLPPGPGRPGPANLNLKPTSQNPPWLTPADTSPLRILDPSPSFCPQRARPTRRQPACIP
jgi:hypothetical protein